jgi:Arc/MetJ-type ribon-helix-helix transcriptional regulator
MAGKVTALHGSDSEKITINLGYVDLGRVDLLVQEGFYSNRSDFIRTAIRNQLAAQAEVVAQSMVRHTLEFPANVVRRAEKPPTTRRVRIVCGSEHYR